MSISTGNTFSLSSNKNNSLVFCPVLKAERAFSLTPFFRRILHFASPSERESASIGQMEIKVHWRSRTLPSRPCSAAWSTTSPVRSISPCLGGHRQPTQPGGPALIELLLEMNRVHGHCSSFPVSLLSDALQAGVLWHPHRCRNVSL